MLNNSAVNFYQSDYQMLRVKDIIQTVLLNVNITEDSADLIFQLMDSHITQKKLNQYLRFYFNL